MQLGSENPLDENAGQEEDDKKETTVTQLHVWTILNDFKWEFSDEERKTLETELDALYSDDNVIPIDTIVELIMGEGIQVDAVPVIKPVVEKSLPVKKVEKEDTIEEIQIALLAQLKKASTSNVEEMCTALASKGTISKSALGRTLRNMGCRLRITDMKSIMTHLDKDCQGHVPVSALRIFLGLKALPEPKSFHELEISKVVHKVFSTMKVHRIEKVFRKKDVDECGILNARDFWAALAEFENVALTASQKTDVLTALDPEKDDRIEYETFLDWISNSSEKTKTEKVLDKKFDSESPFAFSKDAKIRGTETKIRRAVLSARKEQKFDAAKRLRTLDAEGLGILRVDFVTFLMQLGLSLEEDGQNDTSTTATSHQAARQMARLHLHRAQKKNSSSKTLNSALPSSTHDAFDDAARLLQVLKIYRNGQKASLVHTLLRQHITTTHHIYPSYGTSVFWELSLKNPYSHAERFRLECDDPHLHFLTDVQEWQYYRTHVPTSDASPYPLEPELVDDVGELLLEPGEKVPLPVTFLHLDPKNLQDRKITIFCKSVAHGHTVAMWHIHVHLQVSSEIVW